MTVSVAALLTCFNRREKTMACLRSLLGRTQLASIELTVYLLDDGSSDGTAASVRKEFPQVRLLDGDGSLYWNGGMRAAFGAAIEDGYDFYLWLNDDVRLFDGFLVNLFTTYDAVAAQESAANIIVGATRGPVSGAMTYSGFVHASRWKPLWFFKLQPDEKQPLECDTMNGNCVLIPHAVVELIGNLDPVYIQTAGDMDYGFRARKAGAKIWVAPGYVGDCAPNNKHLLWRNPELTLRDRIKLVNTPHGLPFKPTFHYARRYGGWAWPVFFIWQYVRGFLRSIF